MRWLVAIALLMQVAAGAVAAPSCMPGLYGTQVGNADYARTNEGWYAYWFCRKEDGSISVLKLTCVHGSCLPIGTFADLVTTMKRGPDPIATLQAAWDAEVGSQQCAAATGQLKTVCDQAAAAAAANLPPLPVPPQPVPPAQPPAYTHAVAPNPQSTATPPSRPSRQVVDGALKTMTKPVYAPVGSDCDTSVPPAFPSGSDIWAAVVGQPADLRWLCRAK